MQQNQLEAKMKKQLQVSLSALEWFIVGGFLKHIVEDENHVKALFKTQEDCVAIESILDKLMKQYAPHVADNTSDVPDIEELLGIEPKKLHTKTKKLLV